LLTSARWSSPNASGCDDPALTASIRIGEGKGWSGASYRALGRDAIAGVLQEQMAQSVDEHLDRIASIDQAHRRNGCYRRHLLTELGDIELAVPRTRRFARPWWCAPTRAARTGRPDDPVLLCPGTFGAQGKRGLAAGPGAADQPSHW
jgi:hypothetical protein